MKETSKSLTKVHLSLSVKKINPTHGYFHLLSHICISFPCLFMPSRSWCAWKSCVTLWIKRRKSRQSQVRGTREEGRQRQGSKCLWERKSALASLPLYHSTWKKNQMNKTRTKAMTLSHELLWGNRPRNREKTKLRIRCETRVWFLSITYLGRWLLSSIERPRRKKSRHLIWWREKMNSKEYPLRSQGVSFLWCCQSLYLSSRLSCCFITCRIVSDSSRFNSWISFSSFLRSCCETTSSPRFLLLIPGLSSENLREVQREIHSRLCLWSQTCSLLLFTCTFDTDSLLLFSQESFQNVLCLFSRPLLSCNLILHEWIWGKSILAEKKRSKSEKEV